MSNAILLGKVRDHSPDLPVSYAGKSHILTVADTGTGKSMCVSIPNLVRYNSSVFACDWKGGELTIATALWRHAVLGQKVRIFDPFRMVDDRFLPKDENGPILGRINPIDIIRRAGGSKSGSTLTMALKIAESLIPVGTTKETHWPKAAQLRFAATLLFVALDPILDDFGLPRNMTTAWEFLSNHEAEKTSLGWMMESTNRLVRDQAASFYKASKTNLEIASIRNHLRIACTATLGEPCLLDSMSESNIDFRDMGKTPTTVSVVIPGNLSTTHYTYIRLIISLALSEIEMGGLKEYGSAMGPVYFVLEEMATLGNFPLILDAMGRMRGYGVRFHSFVQNLAQLRQLYGDGMNVVTGAGGGVLQYFGGTNCLLTAETISKLCGTSSIIMKGDSLSGTVGGGTSTNHHIDSRPLYTPDEIMRLPLPRQIIKATEHNPMEENILSYAWDEMPDFVAFTKAIKSGLDVDFAVKLAKQYAPKGYIPPPPPPPQPKAKKPGKSLFYMANKIFANMLGQEGPDY